MLFRIFVLFAYFLLELNTIYSQWSSNPLQNNAVVIDLHNQVFPKAISDNDGGIIIVWEDGRTSPGPFNPQRDIYAQRFNKFGFKQWGDTNGLAIAIKPILERNYDLCTDGKGGVIIVWDDNPTSTRTYLKAQRINMSGQKLWSDTGIILTPDENFRQSAAKLSYDGNGGCYYAYQTSELNSSDFELKANHLDSNGNKLWANGIFFCQAQGIQDNLEVSTSSDGNFIITWIDPRNSVVNGRDLYAQKISNNGSVLWTTNGILVCNAPYDQELQKIHPDPSGGIYITWVDKRTSDSITTRNDIYAQRIRSNGQAAFQNNGVGISTFVHDQWRPEITKDGNGGVIITWYDTRNGPLSPFNFDIYAQKLDSSGIVKWTADGLNVCDAPLSQINQKIISDGINGAIITWDDRRAGTSIYDIYAQRIDSSGNLIWDVNDVPISLAGGNQNTPMIVSSGDGAIICFNDYRNGSNNSDIFLQKVLNSGSTIVSLKKDLTALPDNFYLQQNYPNPFNPTTLIRFNIPQDARRETRDVRLIVFDVLGKEILTLIDQKLNAGTYEVEFDGINLSSGVYFYKLSAGNLSDVKRMILVK